MEERFGECSLARLEGLFEHATDEALGGLGDRRSGRWLDEAKDILREIERRDRAT